MYDKLYDVTASSFQFKVHHKLCLFGPPEIHLYISQFVLTFEDYCLPGFPGFEYSVFGFYYQIADRN